MPVVHTAAFVFNLRRPFDNIRLTALLLYIPTESIAASKEYRFCIGNILRSTAAIFLIYVNEVRNA